jgi:hypothetical protein
MAKKCNPSPKVRDAAKTLATSQSKASKSDAARTLAKHKKRSH